MFQNVQNIVENLANWFKIKSQISILNKRPFTNEGEIWWCNLGQNIGDEENGKGDNFMRPVLVLKKFNRNICLCVPLSSQIKENKYYYTIEINQKLQSFLVSQIRTIDTKRFVKKKEQLRNQEFLEVKNYIKQTIFENKQKN